MKPPSLLSQYWRFLREEKRYWLIPLVVVLLVICVLVVLFERSPLAPFIYAVF